MVRTERDQLGTRGIPATAYWGIHTLRATENFPLSGRPVRSGLIRALADVKLAAGRANAELGFIPEPVALALETACREVAAGGLADQFPIDALQGGAGTSLNMNMNEVLANRTLELLGYGKGDYVHAHPLSLVNLHQSTNDTVPTALHVAVIRALRGVSNAAEVLQAACQEKEQAFAAVVKVARTELVPAVPVTLGAEFAAFADAFARDRWRTFKAEERLRAVNLGGTAVGTGLTAPRDYIFLVTEKLREVTGLGLTRADNPMDATANSDAAVETAGILTAMARNLIKTAGDLRLLALLGQIRLAAVQAGSSVMPGKVNPVIPEAVIQAGLAALADHQLVTEAASRATLQINEFLPLMADALLHMTELLEKAALMLAGCIRAAAAVPEACAAELDGSTALVTPFVPELGYDGVRELLEEHERNGAGITLRAFLETRLGTERVRRALSPERITALGYA